MSVNGVVVICVQGRPYACGLAQRRGGCGCYCANQNMWPSGACGPSLCGSVSVASAHLECRVGEVRRHLAGHAARLVAACARCRGVFLVGLASETHCQRCLWSLRSPGEEIRSAAKGRRSDEGAGQGRWSWALGPTFSSVLLFASSYFSWQAGRWPACCSAERVKTVVRPVVRVPSLCAVQLSRLI